MFLLVVLMLLVVLIAKPVTVNAEPRPDPCYDYTQLEAGTAAPERQHYFNHLDLKGYARHAMACRFGWGADQYECLVTLWHEESGWGEMEFDNVPQAKPETKQGNGALGGGPDWRTNQRTGVRWGLGYIHDRYGKVTDASLRGQPCHAGY